MSQEERKEAIETMTLLFTRAKPLDPRAPPTPAIVPSPSGLVPHHPRQAPALVRRNTAPVGKHNTSVASSPSSPSSSSYSASTATSSPQTEGASRYPRISYYDSVKFNVIQVDERQFKNALSKLGTASTPSPTHTPLVSSPSPSYSPSPYSQMPLGTKSMGTLIPLTPGTAPSPPVDSQLAGKVVDTTHSSWWITMALLSGLNYSV
jgi:hypothetical protein